MKHALITGAAGFIGSHLCDRLLNQGYKIVGIDDLSLGQEHHLRGAQQHADNFRFIRADLNQGEALRELLQKSFDGPFEIWHLAANSDIQAGVRDARVDLERTFMTSYNVLQAARGLPVSRLMFASTSAVYGEHSTALSESTAPLLPISNYGAMKLAAEAAISAFAETSEARVLIFRFPNVVGPRSTHGILHDFFVKMQGGVATTLEVLGDGSQEKQYLHVQELLDAMLVAYDKTDEKRAVYNIGVESSTTSVRAIAELFQALVKPEVELRFGTSKRGWVGDVPKFKLDTRKIRSLGWQPRRESTEAVRDAIVELKKERQP